MVRRSSSVAARKMRMAISLRLAARMRRMGRMGLDAPLIVFCCLCCRRRCYRGGGTMELAIESSCGRRRLRPKTRPGARSQTKESTSAREEAKIFCRLRNGAARAGGGRAYCVGRTCLAASNWRSCLASLLSITAAAPKVLWRRIEAASGLPGCMTMREWVWRLASLRNSP